MTIKEIAQKYAKHPHVKTVWVKGKEVFLTPVKGAKETPLTISAKTEATAEVETVAEAEPTAAAEVETEAEPTTEAETAPAENNIKKSKKK